MFREKWSDKMIETIPLFYDKNKIHLSLYSFINIVYIIKILKIMLDEYIEISPEKKKLFLRKKHGLYHIRTS
jgi:hypothetical protein